MIRSIVEPGENGTPDTTASPLTGETHTTMSWKTVSKISRGSQGSEQKVPDEIMPTVIESPSEPRTPKQDRDREGLMETLKQEYVLGKPFDELLAESGIPRATLFRWRREQGWDLEKNKKQILARKLAESLAFYEDPANTEQALAQSNLQLLLRIQGMNLAKLVHKAASGEAPDVIALTMSDSLNKYSSMLEKLIKSDQSIKSGGVERKEVVHVHQLDMDDALRLALELKKKGQQITVQEAMALLQAQQSSKKAKADEHHD